METKAPMTVKELKAVIRENMDDSGFLNVNLDLTHIKKPTSISELKLFTTDSDEDFEVEDHLNSCILDMFNIFCKHDRYDSLYEKIDITTKTKFFVNSSKKFVTLDKFLFEKPTILDMCVAVDKHIMLTGNVDHRFIEEYTCSKDIVKICCGS